jgi:hypothetical protein
MCKGTPEAVIFKDCAPVAFGISNLLLWFPVNQGNEDWNAKFARICGITLVYFVL